MRILLLDQFSDPGGAQQGLLDLLPAISERGWSALAGLPAHGDLFARVRDLGFDAARISCGPYSSGRKSLPDVGRFVASTPLLARQIRTLAKRLDADLVYLNGPRLLPAAALAGVRAPVVFHAHSYLFPGPVRKLAGLSLGRLHARVIAQCHFVAEPWRAFVAPGSMQVIYNGVAGPVAMPPRPSGAPPRIGCIGRIAPEKGQRDFLAACALVHRALPQCTFSIYGAALFADARAARYSRDVHADAAGLPVEFAGWVEDVYAAMASLDLLLVPSAAHEATTRVVLEAFAAGLPVIAFRSGGIPEVVEHGRTGWLADSAGEMAQLAIELLSGERARLAAVARAARESWSRNFTLERYRREVLEAIEHVVEEARSQ